MKLVPPISDAPARRRGRPSVDPIIPPRARAAIRALLRGDDQAALRHGITPEAARQYRDRSRRGEQGAAVAAIESRLILLKGPKTDHKVRDFACAIARRYKRLEAAAQRPKPDYTAENDPIYAIYKFARGDLDARDIGDVLPGQFGDIRSVEPEAIIVPAGIPPHLIGNVAWTLSIVAKAGDFDDFVLAYAAFADLGSAVEKNLE